MSDPIDALTQIIQEHTGCWSDDRPRERCVVHGTDWPCESLSAFVAEVHSWAETYPDVLDCAACRAGEHGQIDEKTDACLCCGEQRAAIAARQEEARAQIRRLPDDCPYGPDCEPSEENCCNGCASGLGPCYGPGLYLACLTHEGENA